MLSALLQEHDAPEVGVDVPPLAVGLALLGTALLLLPALRVTVRQLAPRDAALPRAPWPGRDGLLVLAAALGGLASLPLFLVFGTLGALLHMAFLLALVAAVVVLRARRAAGELAALGLGRGAGLRSGALGLLGYLLFLFPLWGVLALWPHVAPALGIELEVQPVIQMVLALDRASLIVASVFAVAVNPFLEELVFRGFLQTFLARRLGTLGGLVVSSVAFALLHGVSAFGPIFVLSLFLGWLFLRTGRLWTAWAAHATHNGLTLVYLLAAG